MKFVAPIKVETKINMDKYFEVKKEKEVMRIVKNNSILKLVKMCESSNK